jgi:hypothetical protein
MLANQFSNAAQRVPRTEANRWLKPQIIVHMSLDTTAGSAANPPTLISSRKRIPEPLALDIKDKFLLVE